MGESVLFRSVTDGEYRKAQDFNFLKRQTIWAWEELLLKKCCVVGNAYLSIEGNIILGRLHGEDSLYPLIGKSGRALLRESLHLDIVAGSKSRSMDGKASMLSC